MRLPKDLLTQTYKSPDLFLCEVDKTKICRLETSELKASLKFNSYSELTCTIGRTYIDMTTGENKVNPFYDKIEALRLLYLEGFGYFEIQEPEINSDGVMETKEITAYSLEYTLSQKYLTDFYINTGEANSLELINGDESHVQPIRLYDISNPKLSLLHLILEKTYGWSIGHVDPSLHTMSRTFEISRRSVYDFIVQDVCSKFNCFAVFDTIENKISLYAEALITKFIGDGYTNIFTLNPPYEMVETVTIDTYKTTAYQYEPTTGRVIFNVPPANGARIEVIDGSQNQWMTDVYVSFDNLAQEIQINYSAEDIKTVLTVKGEDGLDIREVNMGLPYITDLSYYCTVDWLGQDLFDAYMKYVRRCNNVHDEYMENSKAMLRVAEKVSYEQQRLSLQYSLAWGVDYTTVGTYYVRGGEAPNYYYTAVTLPDDYNISSTYYTLSGNDITETKVSNLFAAMQTYYMSGDKKTIDDFVKLSTDFQFMENVTMNMLISDLIYAKNTEAKDVAIKKFLNEMWNQLGSMPLRTLYYQPYKELQATNIGAGWDELDNENYWRHHPVTVILASLEDELAERQITIEQYEAEYSKLQKRNNEIGNELLFVNNFTAEQLIKLSSFLREDEYTDTNFAVTNSDTTEGIMKLKQELLECGRIELQKLSEPKLGFSMDMANIYALPEFQPIIHQFQLGRFIIVALRNNYVKRARLLEVDINFKDFSDFSCEFGELSNLRTPSSIHADLLANAMIAGNSVASNSSYWSKGSDLATETDLKIKQGLLSATNGLYTSDRSVVIDNTGILLRKVIDKSTGEFSPHQAWLTENNILYSSDAFKSSRAGLGEFVVDGQTFYGVLAEAMFSGYIEGSTIKGGTINIGNGTFVVNSDGSVVMKASSIDGYVSDGNVISSINQSPESIAINANKISLAGKAIDLTSDDITINSTNFSVTKDGNITAQNADISGKIVASSGSIGTWTIDSNSISGTNGNYKALISKGAIGLADNVVFGVYDGSSWSCYMDGVGKFYASNADIKGKITATSGSIGGCNISNGVLNIDAANITSGTINNARISNLSADKITTGTLHVDRIPSLNADKITAGIINVGRIPNLNADKITAGVINVDRIPSLNADKITAGVIHVDRIPSLSADKITVGTLHADRIPNISADKITTGTLSADRLSSSVITTGNFSSKSLSTGNLTIKSGCTIGSATYNARIDIRDKYVYIAAEGPTSYGTTIHEIVKQAVTNGSNRDIKNEIHDFDDRYDAFFDTLNPQLYKYNFEQNEGYSMGYIWQEAEEARINAGLSRNDIGAIYESGAVTGGLGLRKADFIALNTWQIQKLKKKIEELENKLAALET